jgi:hypothetical protein
VRRECCERPLDGEHEDARKIGVAHQGVYGICASLGRSGPGGG